MATQKPRPKVQKVFVTARIEFRPDAAQDFCSGKGQTLVELRFESVEALIECVRELESQIANVTASVNGKVLDLRNLSQEPRP